MAIKGGNAVGVNPDSAESMRALKDEIDRLKEEQKQKCAGHYDSA